MLNNESVKWQIKQKDFPRIQCKKTRCRGAMGKIQDVTEISINSAVGIIEVD